MKRAEFTKRIPFNVFPDLKFLTLQITQHINQTSQFYVLINEISAFQVTGTNGRFSWIRNLVMNQ